MTMFVCGFVLGWIAGVVVATVLALVYDDEGEDDEWEDA